MYKVSDKNEMEMLYPLLFSGQKIISIDLNLCFYSQV